MRDAGEDSIWKGKDARFKRQSAGVYASENGLTVRFEKISSNIYAKVYHTCSGKLVKNVGAAPIKNQGVVLAAAQVLGRRINFRLPEARFIAAAKEDGYKQRVQSAHSGTFLDVYK